MRVAALHRYPIKGIGWERVTETRLAPDAPMPGDRAWAITHRPDAPAGWAPKAAFLQVMQGPRLAAITVFSTDDEITLAHPDLGVLRITLPEGEAELLAWVAPLWPEGRPRPTAVCPAPPKGMADNGQPTLHIVGDGSLAALSDAAERPIDPVRFRPNLIVEGAAPWAELGWIGRRMTVGEALLEVTERTGRCRATEADPQTGARDIDMLRLLKDRFGHTDMGVYARVVEGGAIHPGDPVALV